MSNWFRKIVYLEIRYKIIKIVEIIFIYYYNLSYYYNLILYHIDT